MVFPSKRLAVYPPMYSDQNPEVTAPIQIEEELN